MWRRHFRRVSRSPFSRVAAGSAGGQLAIALSLPLLARLFEPVEIGALATTLVWSQWVTIAISAHVERALPKSGPSVQVAVARLSLLLALVGGLVAGGLVSRVTGASFLSVAALATSMVLFNAGIYAALAARDYGAVTRMRGFNGLATAVLQVGAGFVWATSDALVYTYALGTVVGLLSGGGSFVRLLRQSSCTWTLPVKEHRREIARFAAKVGPSTLLTNVALNVPLVIIAAQYGGEGAATYFLARRILAVPSQFVSRSLSDVSYGVVAKLSAHERNRRVQRWNRIAVKSSLPLMIMGAGLVASMQVVVGDRYPGIILIGGILLVPSVVQAIGTSFSQVLYALDDEKWLLVWSAWRLLTTIGILGLLLVVDLPLAAGVALLSGVGLVAYRNLMRRAVISARKGAGDAG